MIKETKTQQEVIEYYRYCDVCGAEATHTLACVKAICEYCGRDLCEECIGHEEETEGDYREVWCKKCWELGEEYRPRIAELRAEMDALYNEWQGKCSMRGGATEQVAWKSQ